jgi:hypothetical protein
MKFDKRRKTYPSIPADNGGKEIPEIQIRQIYQYITALLPIHYFSSNYRPIPSKTTLQF